MEHVTQEQVEAFVLGIPEPQDAERLRRHVSTCSACGERLQHEARLDLWLHQAALEADDLAMPARLQRLQTWPVVWRSAAAVILLAAGLWVLSSRRGPTSPRHGADVQWPAESAIPGMMDPLATAPGYDVLPPQDYCRFVELPDPSIDTPGL